MPLCECDALKTLGTVNPIGLGPPANKDFMGMKLGLGFTPGGQPKARPGCFFPITITQNTTQMSTVIITDSGDEQPGESITAPIGLRNKRTIQALPKPTYNEWANHINKQSKQR